MKKTFFLFSAALILFSSCEVEVRDGHRYHHHMGYEHEHHPDHHEVYNKGYHHDSHGDEMKHDAHGDEKH